MYLSVMARCRAVTFIIYTLVALAAADDDMKKCRRLHPAMMRCCTGLTISPEIGGKSKEDLKECFEHLKPPHHHPHHHPHPPEGPPPGPPPCDVEECMAKKLGYYQEDGTINKEALIEIVEKQFPDNEEMANALKDMCINGDTSKYGPPDACVYMKVKHCFHNQYLKNCPEWSNEGDCHGIEDLIPDCIRDD